MYSSDNEDQNHISKNVIQPYSYSPSRPNLRNSKSRRPIDPKKRKKQLIIKYIKRFLVALILLVVTVVGFLIFKTLQTGHKIFVGNPLDSIFTKEKLREDKNGRTNILIFGTSGYSMDSNYDGAMLTDSIMVASLDQKNNNVYLMSLPRDLYVKHKCKNLGTNSGKLNETFVCGYATNKNEEEGAKALMDKAGEILGLDIQYYIHADWSALIKLVDAVGGVDVKIESTDPRGIYDSGTNLRLKNNEIAHLNGQKALALARARNHNPGDYGLAGSNYDREKNQQKILSALQKKVVSSSTLLNPTAINGLLDGIGDNIRTNFQTSNVQTLIGVIKSIKNDNIKQLPFYNRGNSLPNLTESYMVDGVYKGEKPVAGLYVYRDIQKYIEKSLSTNPITREGASIDILNGSGVPNLAKLKADDLDSDGYNIAKIGNSPENGTNVVDIYVYNSGKNTTVKSLEDKYNVKAKQYKLDGYNTKADIVIVFGPTISSD